MTTTLVALLMTSALSMVPNPQFQSAKPIWPSGREAEKNLCVGFRAEFTAAAGQRVSLRLTASTLYRLYVNGVHTGYGPARGPHGFYRLDELDITDRLAPGANVVAVEVAGYNVNSYYLIDQPSFLQAEVTSNGKVIASTAGDGAQFIAHILTERVQKAQRYSFQRPFAEVYHLAPGYDAWRVSGSPAPPAVECAVQPAKSLLTRGVPYPTFTARPAIWDIASGSAEAGAKPEKPWADRVLTGISDKVKGYPQSELEVIPSLDLQAVHNSSTPAINQPLDSGRPITLGPNSFHIVDFGVNYTGFIGVRITARKPTRLYLTFDEILSDNDVNFMRMGCVNIIQLDIAPGTPVQLTATPSDIHFESYEPYTFRYLKAIVLDGDCDITSLTVRDYTNPDVYQAHFACSDPRLNTLFNAGRETYRQNAVDVFTDCPSRERAGWLCDSFFTARVEPDLSGTTAVEKNFFENFLLPPKFEHLPGGMLPMCYPSDHNDGVFIPNWALWFVVQLDEYRARSGDTAFIEWSKANEFVQDVNYPSNMLYAKALECAGRLYNAPDLTAEAARIRDVIRQQSFDGQFFVDNALRKDGKLEITKNRSEVCQYFAFFFDVATPASQPDLWKALTEQFGPDRKNTKAFPEIHAANSFVGNMLRFEILSRYGKSQQILQESIGYLLYMAERTGTLWENDGPYASCDHGFASHIVHTLYRDVLGAYSVDTVNKVVHLRFSGLDLTWCEGRIPVPGGAIDLHWWKDNDTLNYRVTAPAGYKVETENTGALKLVRHP
ncbi:MAG: hypothetical protein HZB26_19880 [Candidatus Hydrogenedentes bacterium]|nr:hypothetical protein [Candidatus Hydrogenedentota bacterium]